MINKFLKKNLLFIIIFIAIFSAYLGQGTLPDKHYLYEPITQILFIAIFFIQGCQFSSTSLTRLTQKPNILLISIFFCFVFCPLIISIICATVFGDSHYITIGITLIACMGPTNISGAIIVQDNKADHSLAIALVIILSMISVVAIPLMIKLTLGQAVNLNILHLFTKLFFLVFIPTLVGYLFKKFLSKVIAKIFSYLAPLSILFLGILIFISLLPYINLLVHFTWYQLLICTLTSLLLHQFCLWTSFGLSKASNSYKVSGAVAICSTQKTLPLAIVLWVNFFAQAHPLALFSLIVFHIVQLYSDSFSLKFLAQKFA